MLTKLPDNLHCLRIGATSLAALKAKKQSCLRKITSDKSIEPADFNHYPYRFTKFYQCKSELIPALQQEQSALKDQKICLLFSGQGSQYAGMGKEYFIPSHPAYACMQKICGHLNQHYQLDLAPLLCTNSELNHQSIQQTLYSQTTLMTLEYSQATLWEKLGLQADYMIGHSIGELIACISAGMYTLEQGLELVTTRAQYMQSCSQQGSMLAVFADSAVLAPLLKNSNLTIAGYNSPTQTVISGDNEEIIAFEKRCKAVAIRYSKLAVSHAFHSPLMQSSAQQWIDHLDPKVLQAQPSILPVKIIRNVDNAVANATNTNLNYWQQHITAAVRFQQAVQLAHQQKCTLFIECGPQPILTTLSKKILAGQPITCLSSAKKSAPGLTTLLHAAAIVDSHYQALNWQNLLREAH